MALDYCALAFDVSWPGLKACDVTLPKLKLGGVLNRYDAFVRGNKPREHVQKSRFPRARSSGDDNVEPRFYAALYQFQHPLCKRQIAHQIRRLQRISAEATDG